LALPLFALSVGVVSSSPGAAWASANCPNEQFRTGPGASLPDCRAYEQVSPQEKNGGGVDGGLSLESDAAPDQAAIDGESVTYGSQTAFSGADPQAALASSQYLSRRTPSGWTTTAITPRQELPKGKVDLSAGSMQYSLFQGFGANLEDAFLVAGNPAPVAGAPAGYDMPYVRNSFSGAYTLLSDVKPPFQEPRVGNCCEGLSTEFAGMSADGTHVIFEATDALTPNAIPGAVNLYEWVNGEFELVSVLPNGTVVEGANVLGAASSLGFGGPSEKRSQNEYFNFDHAISSDGRRAFWSGGNGQIYMHEITSSGPRTVDISATQKTNGTGPEGHDPNGPERAHYWAANAEGSLVYFTSAEQLTNEATTRYRSSGGEPPEGDLYQYNVETGKLADITVDEHGGEPAGVQGLLGSSEDGSYVYFAANGSLTPDAPALSATEYGKPYNIYVWHDGAIKLIGTTDRRTGYDIWNASDWNSSLNYRTASVSPDGKYLAFTSTSRFGTNNTEPATPTSCGIENIEIETRYYLELITEEGSYCAQVYEYDATTSKLVCASCAPGGLPSRGNSTVPHSLNLEPRPGWQTNTEQQRYLLNNGRLFFDSTAALSPQDTNGREDVYEYEPAGVGGCTGAESCINLISSGTGARGSQFVDADVEGNNAFFVTFDQLLPSDGDEDLDLYDARVGGGLLSQATPPCQGEACRPALAGSPSIYGPPTSQTFSGSGNVVVAPPVKAVKPTAKIKAKKKVKAKKRGRKRKKGTAKKGQKSGARGSHVHRGNGRGQ
jgi:hypothetical protein